MKLTSIFSFFALAAAGQRVNIGYPPDGTSVTSGSNITVEIDRPVSCPCFFFFALLKADQDTLSGSTEVAIVIAFASCASSPCSSPSANMGSILYNGHYDPVFQSGAPGSKPPHQNFSIAIPSTAGVGSGQLNVAHVSLIGVRPCPVL